MNKRNIPCLLSIGAVIWETKFAFSPSSRKKPPAQFVSAGQWRGGNTIRTAMAMRCLKLHRMHEGSAGVFMHLCLSFNVVSHETRQTVDPAVNYRATRRSGPEVGSFRIFVTFTSQVKNQGMEREPTYGSH